MSLLGLTKYLNPIGIIRGRDTRKKGTKMKKQSKQEEQEQQRENPSSLSYIEKLPSFIFGEPVSWKTGETPIFLGNKLNTLYNKKIKKILRESRQKYRPMSLEDLQKAQIFGVVDRVGDRRHRWEHMGRAIINDQIFEEDNASLVKLAIRSGWDATQSDLDDFKNLAKFGPKGINRFIEPTEAILREKLIKLYKNLDSLDVTSKEWIEIEDLILKLSTRFTDGWNHKYDGVGEEKIRRLLLLKMDFNENIDLNKQLPMGLDYIFGNTDNKYVLHNGLLLNNEDVFFLELSRNPQHVKRHIFGKKGKRLHADNRFWHSPERKSGINYLIKEKRDFIDSFLRKDEIVVEGDRSIAPPLPGTVLGVWPTHVQNAMGKTPAGIRVLGAGFLNNDDTMNIGAASKNMRKKTKQERYRIIKKTKRRKKGTKLGGKKKNKLIIKQKSRRKNKSRGKKHRKFKESTKVRG